MKRFLIKTVEATVLSLLVAGAILTVGDFMQRHHILMAEREEERVHQVVGNPYIHHGDKVPNNVARPGDLIYVNNKYIRTQRCSMRVANLLMNRENDRVHHWTTFNNWLGSGTWVADEMFVIPKWLPPGNYFVVKKTVAECDDGKRYYFVNFDLSIEIKG